MELTKKQTKALDLLEDKITIEILFGGGAGGAKSVLGCYWILKGCLKYPSSRWVIGRWKRKHLYETTLKTFWEVCKMQGVNTSHYNFNSIAGTITFFNGSEILLKDLFLYPADPEFDSLGSLEITGAFIDEANQVSIKAKTILKSRIRYKLDEFKIIPKILYTCNPAKNWVYSEFYKPFVQGSLSIKKAFVKALVGDNPFISVHYVEMLKDLPKIQMERLFYGNFEYDDDPATLIDMDSCTDYFNNEHVKQEGRKYITADIARKGKDKTVVRVWHGWVVVERHEMKVSKVTESADMIRLLANKHEVPMSQTVVDEDGVGCLPENMEVLTVDGWEQAFDITTEDVLISKDLQNNVQMISPHKIIHHEEEMFIEINNTLSFTASHSHYYKTRKEYPVRLDFWDEITERARIYHDTKVNNVGVSDNLVFPKTTYTMPNGGYRDSGIDIDIDSNLLNRFLGWYLSEGYTDGWNNKHVVGITQTSKSHHCKEIEDILTDMGVSWTNNQQKGGTLNQYKFQHKELFLWLRLHCYIGGVYNCYHKKLPNLIKRGTRKDILSFCECFINGDGYYHKGRMTFCSSSKRMLDDIQESLFYCGIISRIHISEKAGSTSEIHGRTITRTVNVYRLSEVGDPPSDKIETKREYYAKAINIKIGNDTKCLLIRNNNKIFWTHNGGVVDLLDCVGFVNNSKALNDENYANLKSQCSFNMAKRICEKKAYEVCNDETVKEMTIEEFEQVKQDKIDIDGKNTIISKDRVKENIGRSPDEWDSIMMREIFELKSFDPQMIRW
ncbi:MAG: LAGLIDADG family homing endonuclease [Candidatus Anammoxibacter sp.]